MTPISKKELLIAAELLKIAAEEFSNHGCNDFDLSAFLSKKECIEFDKEFHEWNGDPEEHDPDPQYTQDWIVMDVLAEKLKLLAEGM